jgi:hypothetical protein
VYQRLCCPVRIALGVLDWTSNSRKLRAMAFRTARILFAARGVARERFSNL